MSKKDELTSEQQSFKKKLDSYPRVKLTIPKDKLNPNKHIYAALNGIEYYVAVGKPVELPQPIADIVMSSLADTEAAYERITTDNEVMA